MPRRGLRLAAPPAYEVQYRTIHGYRRAFVCVGSGPALLLLHGIGNDLDSWRDVIPDLARDHTVIAPDLLGHGRSDKPRADYSIAAYANGMRDLLSVLDIERVTVIGHSLGGGVATQFAYQFPERCERIVLVSSGGVSRDVHLALRLATAPLADQVMALIDFPGTERALRIWLALMQALDHDIALDRGPIMNMFTLLDDAAARRAFVAALRAAVDWRGQVVTMLDRCYLTKGMPILLVWGTRDAVIPFQHGLVAHTALPGSRFEVFEGAGHFPHHFDTPRFTSLVREFVGSTWPATYDTHAWRALLRAGRPGYMDHVPEVSLVPELAPQSA